MEERKRRANQREGYVFEHYADASAQVESLKRMVTEVTDPETKLALMELHRKARNARERARTKLEPYEDASADIYNATSPEDRKAKFKVRDQLVGEIFIRIYHVHLATQAAQRILGAKA